MKADQIKLLKASIILSFLCMALGAFGKHALHLDFKQSSIFDTALKYHMFHSLALLALSSLGPLFVSTKQIPQPKNSLFNMRFIANAMLLSMGLFCGSLYALSIFQIKFFAYLTPIGGVLLMLSWILLFKHVHIHFGQTKT